jgi:hypothetical protein
MLYMSVIYIVMFFWRDGFERRTAAAGPPYNASCFSLHDLEARNVAPLGGQEVSLAKSHRLVDTFRSLNRTAWWILEIAHDDGWD